MTLIAYFVAAFYHKKSHLQIKKIIYDCGQAFMEAKAEYDCINETYGSDGVLEYISERLKYRRGDFEDKYLNGK